MSDSSKPIRRPKARKFFDVGPNYRTGGAPPYEIENRKVLIWEGLTVFVSHPYRRGFPNYPEPPRVLLNKKAHRPIRDLEDCSGYWLISDRAKQLFEALDPEGFAFVKCEARFTDGDAGPTLWLCDVVRVLDALDEASSAGVATRYESDGKKYSFSFGSTSLVFKEDVVRDAHIFRMAYFKPKVISDQYLKDACKAAGLKGISFDEVFHPAFDKFGTITRLNAGSISLEDGKQALVSESVFQAAGVPLRVGDSVRVFGHYNRNYRYYSAERLEKV
jgi:hypothetical protein